MDKSKISSQLTIRRAQAGDFEQLVKLQDANLGSNLTDEQKLDGFLSGQFSAKQFEMMNDDLCVVVAIEGQAVKAFLCTSSVESNKSFPLPKAMIDRFGELAFDSKPLPEYGICIGGPVCIDASLRGQGILTQLYDCFYRLVPQQYNLVVLFVSVDNPRSIKAHEKLGMVIIDEFEYRDRRYVTMSGRVPR